MARRHATEGGAVVAGLLATLAAIAGLLFAFAPGERAASRSTQAAAATALPPQVDALVSQTMGRDDRAYHARRDGSELQAVNRRHGLSVAFAGAGVQVRGREDRIGVKLGAMGRGTDLRPVGSASPIADRNRVEYRRPGVTEWYANGPLGLEQGFTIPSRPGAAGALTLALDVRGGRPRLEDARNARLSERLAYRGLWASDARGRDLPAWLEVQRDRVLVRVDDSRAIYPVTVDPFFQAAKLTASDGAPGDWLGTSVAISGDTVVVGAPGDDDGGTNRGSAYVFVKPASGWANATQTAKLSPSAGSAGDDFGQSISVDGDTVVVGAPDGNEVYVFVKPPGGWANATQTALLTVTGLPSYGALGQSVDVEGDVIVAGAIYSTAGGANNEGAGYVYEKPPGGWVNDATPAGVLVNFYGEADDLWGWSIAISGTSVAMGAYSDNVDGKFDQGSVVIFNRPAATWGILNGGIEYHEAQLFAPDGLADDFLGWSVDISGPIVVAGAPGDDVGGNPRQGSVYVYQRSDATSWPFKKQLLASDGVGQDNFGSSVSISGNTVAVGAPGDAVGPTTDQGSSYVFANPGSGWENALQTGRFSGADGVTGDALGTSIGYSGGVVVSGGPFAPGAPGVAYVHVEDSIAPGAPSLSGLTPGAVANANNPAVLGSAEGGTIVRLYLTNDCSGAVLAEGPASALASGLGFTVTDNSVTTLRATATDAAGNVSACSAAVTYTEDSAAPGAPAVNGPSEVVVDALSRFTATADDGSGAGVAPEGIRWSANGLAPATGPAVDLRFPETGTYALQVTATDRAGNTSPASNFGVRVRPLPRITSGIKRRFLVFQTYTVFKFLIIRDAPVGAAVRVSCKGKGCPKKARRQVSKGRKEMPFTSYIRNRRLRPGAVLEIRITLAGRLGKVVRYQMRKAKSPVVKVLCVEPGASRATACPKGSD